MKLVSWNVNGLRACLGKGFLDFFSAADADAVCLQETKMHQEQADLELPGYQQFWNSAEKRVFRHGCFYACAAAECNLWHRYGGA